MIANAASSTRKVPLGTRKLLSASWMRSVFPLIDGGPVCQLRRWGASSLSENEDEQRHEGQVDEEHRLDQTDRQEEDRLESALGLRLASHALDVGRPGQTVTDTSADGATGEGHATTDEGAGRL